MEAENLCGVEARSPTPVYPRYRCIKCVNAFQITDLKIHHDDLFLFKDGGDAVVKMPVAWFNKHNPAKGGYFVKYDDGYESYSPADAFERGYIPFDPVNEDQCSMLAGFAHDALHTLQRFLYRRREESRKADWNTAKRPAQTE